MRFFLGALTSIFLISSCATTIPMPAHLSTLDTAALRQKLEKSKVAVKDYSAEARLSYFGREGRLRGSAIVAVQRSDKIRIEILGPHGGTLSAFATDGKEVGLFDLGGEHFLYGKATAANLDRALSLVPLSQDATAWASLFFGEVLIPANAKLSWDEKRGELVLSWSEDHLDRVVGIDPESFYLKHLAIFENETLVAEVEVQKRDKHGLPLLLYMHAPVVKSEVKVELRDLEIDVGFEEAVFLLKPPPGVQLEYLP